MAIPFPTIDPVALYIGPIPYLEMTLAIRWYSLAYIAGIVIGWWYVAREHARKPIPNLSKNALDDIITWAVIGVVGGGRLGYVLFYKPGYYLENPGQILHLWEGGMSFHGGLLGVIIAFILFARKHKVRFFQLIDIIACATPIGLFFGRLANFINGELYGRVTDAPWGMVFPGGGDLPRHPSQLYEAALEGVVLFGILYYMLKFTSARDKPGMLGGTFIAGYAVARMIVEFFREPDDFLGYLFGFVTMGQLLCLPMLAYGLYLIFRKAPAYATLSRKTAQ
jgi:phosphatidylglycerol---prolipoprotein diacylglyceryl transferase